MTRRVILWNMMTLDGRMEGPSKWDLWFHQLVWGDEIERFSLAQGAAADTILFGRVTYEGMAAYWQSETGAIADMMNTIAKVVFSRTLDEAAWNNTRLVQTDPVEEVARLKRAPGKDILIFGSAELADTLLRKGMIDEVRLCLVPVVIGDGTPLFKSGPQAVRMKLLEVRPLESGGVILFYEPMEPK